MPKKVVKKVKKSTKTVSKPVKKIVKKTVKKPQVVVRKDALLENKFVKMYLFFFVFSILVLMLFVLGKYIGIAKSLSSKEALLFSQEANPMYSCPAKSILDCKSLTGEKRTKYCATEAVEWYKKSCPNFKGISL